VRGRPVGGELPGFPLGWERWLTGGYEPAAEEVEFHEGAAGGEFPVPPVANATWGFAQGVMAYLIHNDPDWTYAGYDFFDFGRKAARLAPTVNADSPDLTAFRARGGKLIIDNGWMDMSLSPYHTIDYYEQVLALDPSAREDVRLFLRPGVVHCGLGPGPDGTDYLAAVDEWLDTGEAPEQLSAPFRNPAGKPAGSRIVCAYPNMVTYDGSGDPRDPASFNCSAPE
jgi:feruloyl esterase